MEPVLEVLKGFGLSVADYFLTREELVTGDLPPARFVLRVGEESPLEVENLSGLVSAVCEIGTRSYEVDT